MSAHDVILRRTRSGAPCQCPCRSGGQRHDDCQAWIPPGELVVEHVEANGKVRRSCEPCTSARGPRPVGGPA